MVEQSKGKIYLSGERGHTETDWFRSYNTFNFGSYQNENRIPFGPLYVCNEDTIAAGKSFSFFVEQDSDIVLVPTVGVVGFKENNDDDIFIEAGQVFIHTVISGTTIHFSNPLESELVNFLQLWLTHPSETAKFQKSFELNDNRDHIIPLFFDRNSGCVKLSIGKLTGRCELEYVLSTCGNGLFVFVIEGAFEVQYRLLEASDSLALWDLPKVEFEALSNDAIILLLEVSGIAE